MMSATVTPSGRSTSARQPGPSRLIGAGKPIPSPPLASAWLICAMPSEPSARVTSSADSRCTRVGTTAGPTSGRSARAPARPSTAMNTASAGQRDQTGAASHAQTPATAAATRPITRRMVRPRTRASRCRASRRYVSGSGFGVTVASRTCSPSRSHHQRITLPTSRNAPPEPAGPASTRRAACARHGRRRHGRRSRPPTSPSRPPAPTSAAIPGSPDGAAPAAHAARSASRCLADGGSTGTIVPSRTSRSSPSVGPATGPSSVRTNSRPGPFPDPDGTVPVAVLSMSPGPRSAGRCGNGTNSPPAPSRSSGLSRSLRLRFQPIMRETSPFWSFRMWVSRAPSLALPTWWPSARSCAARATRVRSSPRSSSRPAAALASGSRSVTSGTAGLRGTYRSASATPCEWRRSRRGTGQR